MRPYVLLLTGLAACAGNRAAPSPANDASSSPARVVLDGDFNDWAGVTPRSTRAAGGVAPTTAELTTLRVRDDGRYVYFQIDLARPINLLGFDGSMTLALNTDGDDATGATVEDLAGTDVALDFSPRGANGRITEGLTMRVI